MPTATLCGELRHNLQAFRDRLGLQELQQVIGPARLGVGARHIEPDKRMRAHNGSGALVRLRERSFGSQAVSVFLNRDGKGCVKPFAERICDFIHFGLIREHERLGRAQREALRHRLTVFQVLVGLQL